MRKLLEEGEGGISGIPSRGASSASQPQITMVKIGRSVVTGSDDGPDKGLPGKKARPPTYSTLESQTIKELITVVLVRHGYDRHSETRRVLVVDSEMSFTDFRSQVCATLGLSDSYPVRLTVEDVRSAINGGTRMGTLFEEAMEHARNEGVLYVRH